jgi:hypothetical protein
VCTHLDLSLSTCVAFPRLSHVEKTFRAPDLYLLVWLDADETRKNHYSCARARQQVSERSEQLHDEEVYENAKLDRHEQRVLIQNCCNVDARNRTHALVT